MRRLLVVPVLAVALAVSACGTSSGTKRTVTVVNTITSSAAPATATGSTGPTVTGSGVTVIGSTPATGSVTGTSGAPTTAASTTTSSSVSAAPFVKLDPLTATCPTLLASSDIKKAIGATVGTGTNRIRLGAADRGVTGAIRCLYGSKDSGKSAPVRIRLTQYSSAAAAKKQIGVDVETAQDGGATLDEATVNGYPASLLLFEGGVIEMAYDTWTLSVAVDDKLASNAQLTSGLPLMAGQVLTRIIKNA